MIEKLFNIEEFEYIATSKTEEYALEKPYPHICLQGFFNENMLQAVHDNFPSTKDGWRRSDNEWESKGGVPYTLWGDKAQKLSTEVFCNQRFIDALETLTGIEDLLVDDKVHVGDGCHQIDPGGFLKVHADFNMHPKNRTWQRKINVLLYLNPGWKKEWGGDLELWDHDSLVVTIPPIINTLVIFNTSNESYHGHPHPLQCPPDRVRRSFAAYYYTHSDNPPERHSTLFLGKT